ncbi:MAG: GyrI-like domain-containing protein [Anaerolineae bacterium]|nr:GyrI-like domain-containing protein [Anaerolineae bacterium]
MEPIRFETRQITLLGMGFFGDPFRISGGWTEENEIGRLWSRFMAYLASHGDEIAHAAEPGVAYELHVPHEESERTGEYEVFVGVEVSRLEDIPLYLSAKILPRATYAVFSLQGDQVAGDWWQDVYATWMAQAGYESAGGHMLERYDERFKGIDRMNESILEIYLPVRQVGGAG